MKTQIFENGGVETKRFMSFRFQKASFLKRMSLNGASISILLGVRVHLGNIASVREVLVKSRHRMI